MKNPDIVTTVCPCGANIKHHETDTPRRCVCCHKVFVKAEDVVVLEGQAPPTIVKVKPVNISGKPQEVK